MADRFVFPRLLATPLLLAVLCWPLLASAVPPHAVAFMYHRFGDDRFPSTNVTLEQFDAHLDWIAANDYRVWPLARIVETLQDGGEIPDKVLAITIDDAYLSVYEHALPRLRERDWPFTLFVSSDPVDDGLDDYMNWQQLCQIQAAGGELGNHSASHDFLVARRDGEDEADWRRRVRADIERGQRRLREETGQGTNRAMLLAYPFGEYDNSLTKLVAEMGYTAFGQHSGAIGRHSDWQRLPRYPVNEDYAALEDFAGKAASLPLPVVAVEPREPVLGENPPRLNLTLAPGDYRAADLACYASGQGRIRTEIIPGPPLRLLARAGSAFASGRARYNCTAPAASGGRFYWYSHPWLIPPIGGH